MRKTIIALGVLTSLVLVVNLVRFWPDGKLHIVFCDVGQGDAAYIRFPDSQDMLIDAGPPNGRVVDCLAKHMPFFDRQIDVVMLTHPQADHHGGLPDVLKRYTVLYFVSPPVGNETDGFKELVKILREKKITVKNLYRGTRLKFGQAIVDIDWPEREWVALKVQNEKCNPSTSLRTSSQNGTCIVEKNNSYGLSALQLIGGSGSVLGVSTSEDLNHFSIIAHLSYGTFDTLFTGDSDRENERMLLGHMPPDLLTHGVIEVLKTPHHGSKTGMLPEFIARLRPKLAVIEVGAKNRYGHPAKESIALLQSLGAKVMRTDRDGTVEVVSEGRTWWVVKK